MKKKVAVVFGPSGYDYLPFFSQPVLQRSGDIILSHWAQNLI